jgi:threonine synthase
VAHRSKHPEIAELRQISQSFSVSDEQIADTIALDYSRSQRIWCPHTATAVHVRRHLSSPNLIIVATSHRAKFDSVVEPLIGRSLEMPPSLEQLFEAPSRFEEIDPEFETLKEALQ